jgi:hypothetical protein
MKATTKSRILLPAAAGAGAGVALPALVTLLTGAPAYAAPATKGSEACDDVTSLPVVELYYSGDGSTSATWCTGRDYVFSNFSCDYVNDTSPCVYDAFYSPGKGAGDPVRNDAHAGFYAASSPPETDGYLYYYPNFEKPVLVMGNGVSYDPLPGGLENENASYCDGYFLNDTVDGHKCTS